MLAPASPGDSVFPTAREASEKDSDKRVGTMMKKQDRRRFLKATGALAISAIVPSLGCDRNEVTFRSMPTAPDPVPEGTLPSDMPNSPVTPNERFYLQSINGKDYDPRLKAENWSLRVDGLVDNSIAAMTYDEIIAMPMADRLQMTMQCIGNWVGGPFVGNAWWGGTKSNNLLDSAGVADEAIRVKFYSIDGYTTSIPLERARRDEVLLVWEMNDEVLPSKHGFPVRLVNPGTTVRKCRSGSPESNSLTRNTSATGRVSLKTGP